MEALLIVLAAAAAVISAVTYPLCPKSTAAVSVVTTFILAGALALLIFAPKDYMRGIRRSMTAILHTWILGGLGILKKKVGAGAIVGVSARFLMSRKASK